VTVPTTIDAAGWLGKHLEGDDGDVDLARAMLAAFANTLMSAEASAACGAAFNERCEERVNARNGYRHRDWDTRVGTIDLAVPKLREGTYYPDWLLVPRRRAEQALVTVIGQAYVEGVSTRRVDDLVRAMGIDGISASQVSRMAAELDAKVTEFRERPLDAGPYRYLWIDALTQKVREGGAERIFGSSLRFRGCQRAYPGHDSPSTVPCAAHQRRASWSSGAPRHRRGGREAPCRRPPHPAAGGRGSDSLRQVGSLLAVRPGRGARLVGGGDAPSW
jgi:hypothetical protein